MVAHGAGDFRKCVPVPFGIENSKIDADQKKQKKNAKRIMRPFDRFVFNENEPENSKQQ
jgi:hypothetical protein